MERLDFTEGSKYNPVEASIHLNRYLTTKQYVRGKRVLDIACGEGYGSKLMKNWGAASVVGVDTSEEALTVANNYFSGEGISFLNHTAEELPFENDSFDVVVSFETVEHLDHPENFLREVARVVKFDGVVLISCPNDPYIDIREGENLSSDPAYYYVENSISKFATALYDYSAQNEVIDLFVWRSGIWIIGLMIFCIVLLVNNMGRMICAILPSIMILCTLFLAVGWQIFAYQYFFPIAVRWFIICMLFLLPARTQPLPETNGSVSKKEEPKCNICLLRHTCASRQVDWCCSSLALTHQG